MTTKKQYEKKIKILEDKIDELHKIISDQSKTIERLSQPQQPILPYIPPNPDVIPVPFSPYPITWCKV